MIEKYRRWWLYECQMSAQIVQSLESVPDERRNDADYQRAISIFAHTAAARRIWLQRFGETTIGNPALFPTDVKLDQVVTEWQEIAAMWSTFLQQLDNAKLGEIFEYRSLDGRQFRNTVEEVLTHLFSHGSYHRGQIAMLVRNAGGQPAATDYIYWCRQEIAPAN